MHNKVSVSGTMRLHAEAAMSYGSTADVKTNAHQNVIAGAAMQQ